MSKLNDMMLQFGTDKFLHFAGGACVMAITNSWIILAIVAIGKEIYDYQDYGNFSKADVIATTLGGIFGFLASKGWILLSLNII
jgi:predicted oxidoreductase (fatty acid repression mutant protein)